MPLLIDEAAKETALRRWVLPACLHVPVAAVDCRRNGVGVDLIRGVPGFTREDRPARCLALLEGAMNRRDFGATVAATVVMALFFVVRAVAARVSGGKLSGRAVTVVTWLVLVVLAAGAAGGAILFEEMSSK